ncbi:transcriptional regulator family: Fungal Specific TF [Penicillium brevicompactum]
MYSGALHRKRKVKTGCKTCKKRRVKCDEGRPACRQCVSSSRPCDGYGIWGGGGTPYMPPQSHRTLSVYCTPVPAGSLNDQEQVCFDWLIKRTAKKFAGIFQSDFWETLIFQASAQEPAVRHAVIALASAHRFEQRFDPRFPDAPDPVNEQFTLQQYNKAILHLRTKTTQTSHSLRVALITCMLFVTLEYLRGQYLMGSAHLRYGMRLLTEISASTSKSAMTPKILRPKEDFAYNALVDTYAQLGIQSAMFGHIPSNMCLVTQDPQSTIPYIFSSLLEARRSIDDHLNRIHCLKRHFRDQRPDNIQEMSEVQSCILADLVLWRKAYNASLARLESHNTSGRDKFGYLLLRVYHEMATIMASVCLAGSEDSEMIFDEYTENFITIMSGLIDMWKSWTSANFPDQDLSKLTEESSNFREIFEKFQNMSDTNVFFESSLLEILEHSSEINDILKTPDCGGSGFTVETGYIPPFYYTALKCRVPRIRRQAVRALRAAPHREGVWNGPLLASVLEAVIKIEEADLYKGESRVHSPVGFLLPRPDDLLVPKVPAEARISDVKVILPDHVPGEVYINYRKKAADGEWAHFRKRVELQSRNEPR